ncbi:hypothetical protein [Nocardia camponoti]|uniref:Uncharacterized protein n=1 Tax=Nocardia camponoti TaxID=1616106 RepID=A0A917QAZ4_9NOCA|nr:hypothetical protein [Nocardia camponoti]GGK40305.1 hypothetical protein GCM10011591_09940 [Nocardia camponoti]
MTTVNVQGWGIVEVGTDIDADFLVNECRRTSIPALSDCQPNAFRMSIEVQQRWGGIAPRALLGCEFIPSKGTSTELEVGVSSFGMLDAGGERTCPSRLWKFPFTAGLPTDLAEAVMSGLTRTLAIRLRPGTLRIDRAGFDVVNSADPVFASAASLLIVAVAAQANGTNPVAAVRMTMETWRREKEDPQRS